MDALGIINGAFYSSMASNGFYSLYKPFVLTNIPNDRVVEITFSLPKVPAMLMWQSDATTSTFSIACPSKTYTIYSANSVGIRFSYDSDIVTIQGSYGGSGKYPKYDGWLWFILIAAI